MKSSTASTFDIADGEFVVLVGPSGCGKSTLLRMIAGLENITGGVIRIDNRVVNHVPPKERDVAMVFQNYALYPHMTVADNLGFSLKLRRAPRAEIKARVDRAAQILGLSALLDRYPRQLSGGQRQRVAMGRAIVRDPKVFLFDEPLSNLDAKLRVAMRTEIKELHQRLETTTVYVTHDQIEAMTMADKIVVMHDGRVEQIGAPLDLYDRPDNVFRRRLHRLAGHELSYTARWASTAPGNSTAHRRATSARCGTSRERRTSGDLRRAPRAFRAGRRRGRGGSPRRRADRRRSCRSWRSSASEEIIAVFRERHQFKPGQMIRLKPDARLRASV